MAVPMITAAVIMLVIARMILLCHIPVSYTHLDVYKRQALALSRVPQVNKEGAAERMRAKRKGSMG